MKTAYVIKKDGRYLIDSAPVDPAYSENIDDAEIIEEEVDATDVVETGKRDLEIVGETVIEVNIEIREV